MVKCDCCGKFISYLEFQNRDVVSSHEPLSEFGNEKITFTHKACEKE